MMETSIDYKYYDKIYYIGKEKMKRENVNAEHNRWDH